MSKTTKAGRPTLYKPEYCAQLIELMEQGYSLLACAGEFGVGKRTLKDWEANHEEFARAVAIGKSKLARWWEEKGRKIAEDGGGNGSSTMVAFALKNLAKEEWNAADKVEHTGKDGAPLALGNADLSSLSAQTLLEIKQLLEANSVPRVVGGKSTVDD
jgi:transposase